MSQQQIDLYYMVMSSPCRNVLVVAAAAGIKLNKIVLDLMAGEHMKPEYLKLNPQHKVPFIVDGELRLNDSHAICAYLCNKYLPANNTLYPHEPVARAHVDELLHYNNSTLFPKMGEAFYPLFFGGKAPIAEDKEKAMRDVFAYVDTRAKQSGKKFLLGDHLTIADLIVATSLTLPSALDYDLGEFKAPNEYRARVAAAAPNFNEINDAGVVALKKFVEAKKQQQQ